ncbi:HPr family phosphocarrier protein [Effusibacillus pohliae]|uniref:HPr family phosphocarrier protein n=1 Tax=Effusibacillus pohliae TaxID=232270 RepID=UPI0009FBAEAE|nr:HPr family phosphocarrier protein [Effusibacillus pohliae]
MRFREKKCGSDVWLIKDGRKINAKSLVSIMSLGVRSGEQVTLEVEPTDPETLDRLAALLESMRE